MNHDIITVIWQQPPPPQSSSHHHLIRDLHILRLLLLRLLSSLAFIMLLFVLLCLSFTLDAIICNASMMPLPVSWLHNRPASSLHAINNHNWALQQASCSIRTKQYSMSYENLANSKLHDHWSACNCFTESKVLNFSLRPQFNLSS